MGTARSPLASAWRATQQRTVPWPTLGERIGVALLAWLPIALLIGYGGGAISGCDRAAASCPEVTDQVQAGLLLAMLVLLLALPRVAYLGAWGAAGVALTGLVLAVPASILGNRFAIPLPFVAVGTGLLVAAYLAGAVLAARDRPIPRPWTLPGRRRPRRPDTVGVPR